MKKLFYTFSFKYRGYLFQDEFMNLMHFVLYYEEDQQVKFDRSINDSLLREIFYIYSTKYEDDLIMSYNTFENLVGTGQKVHPLYLKFMRKFGEGMEKVKKKSPE